MGDQYEFGDRALARDVEGLRDPALDTPLVPPDRIPSLLAAAQRLVTDKDMARLAGVTPRTWADWKRRARVQEAQVEQLGVEPGRFAQLFRAIEEAQSEGTFMLSNVIFDAAVGDASKGVAGDPKYALEILSRRRPSEWGAVSRFRMDADEVEEARELLALAAAGRSLEEGAHSTPKVLDVESRELGAGDEPNQAPAAAAPNELDYSGLDGDLAALLAETEADGDPV